MAASVRRLSHRKSRWAGTSLKRTGARNPHLRPPRASVAWRSGRIVTRRSVPTRKIPSPSHQPGLQRTTTTRRRICILSTQHQRVQSEPRIPLSLHLHSMTIKSPRTRSRGARAPKRPPPPHARRRRNRRSKPHSPSRPSRPQSPQERRSISASPASSPPNENTSARLRGTSERSSVRLDPGSSRCPSTRGSAMSPMVVHGATAPGAASGTLTLVGTAPNGNLVPGKTRVRQGARRSGACRRSRDRAGRSGRAISCTLGWIG